MDYLIQSALLEQDSSFADALAWLNPWNSHDMGLVGIHPEDPVAFTALRGFISSKMYDGHVYNTYPKELIAKRYDYTAILKRNLRTFNMKVLTKAIFKKNPQLNLRGDLLLHKSKKFGKHERSKQGESKADWKLALLSGDEAFMQSIKHLPNSHPFSVGSASIQIRGGERRREGKRDDRVDIERPRPQEYRPQSHRNTSSSQDIRRPRDRQSDGVTPSQQDLSPHRSPDAGPTRPQGPQRSRSPTPKNGTTPREDRRSYAAATSSREPPKKSPSLRPERPRPRPNADDNSHRSDGPPSRDTTSKITPANPPSRSKDGRNTDFTPHYARSSQSSSTSRPERRTDRESDVTSRPRSTLPPAKKSYRRSAFLSSSDSGSEEEIPVFAAPHESASATTSKINHTGPERTRRSVKLLDRPLHSGSAEDIVSLSPSTVRKLAHTRHGSDKKKTSTYDRFYKQK